MTSTQLSTEIPLDLRATVDAFSKGWNRVSWSKLTTFAKCPMSWFFENYAVPLNREVYAEDSLAAIPGTIIQRVWEGFVNLRVYRELPSLDAQAEWMNKQSIALFNAIVLPYEEQFNIPSDKARKWMYKGGGGHHRLELATRDYGLHPGMYKGAQAKFTDPKRFAAKYGSVEKFHAKLAKQYRTMLEKFASMPVNYDQMLVEQFVSAKFGEHDLAGGVDFLYNRHPMAQPFTELSQLQDDYLILDGKNQIGPSVHYGQLFMYAFMLHLRYRKLPSMVGFIDWSKSDFVWYNSDLAQITTIKTRISQMQSTARNVKQALEQLALTTPPDQNTLYLKDVPFLTFKPGRISCMFCKASDLCADARATGNSRTKADDYIAHTKAVADLDTTKLSPTSLFNDVSFE